MKKGGEKMKGVMLAARFSLGCNEVVFRSDRIKALKQFLQSPSNKNLRKAQEILKNLPVLYPYLSLIARCNNLNPFDEKVVEAYFIGNQLLENIPFEESCKTIKEILESRGIAQQKIKIILRNLLCFYPHHNFHIIVLLPRFSEEKPPLHLLDLCRVAWGKIIKRGEREITVEFLPLREKQNGFKLDVKPERILLTYPRDLFPQIKIGDIVALHWGKPCAFLNPKQFEFLQRCTQKALEYATIKGE